MAQLYGKKTSDGLPKALECTDEGLLKVDTELTATIDPTGLATEATAGDIKTAVEALAVATPDTASGDLASMSADIDTMQTDLATVTADIALMKADLATVAASTTCTHDSITLTAANTQYSKAISENCKKLTFRVVDSTKLNAGSDIRYAWAADKVAAATLPFMLLDGGSVYSESNLLLTSKTLYVAGVTAGDIVLMEMWS